MIKNVIIMIILAFKSKFYQYFVFTKKIHQGFEPNFQKNAASKYEKYETVLKSVSNVFSPRL